jgi:hypothetical protein
VNPTITRVDVDWRALEAAVREQITGFVRQMRAEHPDDRIYGAAVHEFYADGDVIAWTLVGVASEESVPEPELRWSPADWEWQLDPGETGEEWSRRLTAAATEGDFDAVHERYLSTVVAACKAAGRELGDDIVVVAMDEAWELIPRCLTEAQLRQHFPELDEERRELDRLAALPAETRAAELITLPAAIGREKALGLLRDIGPAAVPLVVEQLSLAREKWQWAMLLAELGVPAESVISALDSVLGTRKLREPDRAWAAAALARLGRMDLVADRLERLPEEVGVRGLTGPYMSFRDVGVHGPLDYAPLADALTRHPSWQAAVLKQFKPGGAFCELAPDEVPTALEALSSPHAAIRRHAVIVLSHAPTTAAQRDEYLAALARLSREDPDPAVRDTATAAQGWR